MPRVTLKSIAWDYQVQGDSILEVYVLASLRENFYDFVNKRGEKIALRCFNLRSFIAIFIDLVNLGAEVLRGAHLATIRCPATYTSVYSSKAFNQRPPRPQAIKKTL